MLANLFGGDLPIVILIAVIVIFGGSQLPKIARNVGSAGREFRKAQAEAEDEAAAKAAAGAKAAAERPAVTAGPAATPAPPQPPSAAVAEGDEKVTLSKAELNALLDERLGKGETRTGN